MAHLKLKYFFKVDYKENAWETILASVYVKTRPLTAVKCAEREPGLKLESTRIDNVPTRVKRLGDLWEPLLAKHGRFTLEVYL